MKIVKLNIMVLQVVEIQFDRKLWNPENARKELKHMGYVPIKKVNISKNMLHYKIKLNRGYNSYLTKKTTKGINLVIGKKN